MDDYELLARFAGIRLALAYAIKAASRTPADLAHHVEAFREIESLIPANVHPAAKEELDGVVRALTHMPVRDPAHGHHAGSAPHPVLPTRDADLPPDLLR